MDDEPSAPDIDFEALTAQVAAADALYTSSPGFEGWVSIAVATGALDQYRDLLSEERSRATAEDLRKAVAIAIRAAAIDTGAIEGLYETDRGFTFAVANQLVGWELAVAERGRDVRQLFEAQLAAYEMVLDMATGRRPLSESWIRQLHAVICAPQETHKVLTSGGWREQTLVKGAYKETANHVSLPDGRLHSYAPVQETPREMQRFVGETRSSAFQNAESVVQAAYVHYCLVKIHPFADGNGRVARALTSVFLYRAEFVPFVVYADLRPEYLLALQRADEGDYSLFVDFVLDRLIDTFGEVRQNLRRARLGDLSQSASEMRTILTGHGGLTHREIDAVATRCLETLETELDQKLQTLNLPPDVTQSVRLEHAGVGEELPSGFRPNVTNQRQITLMMYSQPPAQASIQVSIRSYIATNREARRPILLRASELGEDFEIRIGDVFPQELPSFRQRIATWTEVLVLEALSRLRAQANQALVEAGYPDDGDA